MGLRNKITVATSVVGLLLLLLGLSGAWYVLQLQRSHSQVLDVNVSSVRAAEGLEMTVREIRHELDRFLLTQEIEHLQLALAKQKEIRQWLQDVEGLSSGNDEARLVEDIQKGTENFFEQLKIVIASDDQPSSAGAAEQLVSEVLTDRVLASAHQYLNLNELELQASNQQNKTMAERLALALLLLGTCGAIAGLVVGYGIARGISRSILQLSIPIRDVAGKLNEVVGPVEISTDPNMTELETILQEVSSKVGAVVEQLHTRHREVVRADQLVAVGQLAAGMAHEIRNPLMCMKTLVQSTRRKGADSRLDPEDLIVLDEEITRLESFLQSFMDFARPANPNSTEVNLNHIIVQTMGLIKSKSDARNVKIIYSISSPSIVVQCDDSQLRQVLLNLLLNALDAVSNGGSIWIDATQDQGVDTNSGQAENRPKQGNGHSRMESTPRGQMTVLRISDNGRGLPVTDRNRIFEPFFSTRETGLGLGLPISKRIIDAHHGQLDARDRDGGGTIVEIQFPFRAAEND